jgi:isoquinoline 1-oxidoreductase beta subunit
MVPPGAWRSTGSYANVFYLESFIDELARAAGRDAIDYRRDLVRAASPASFENNAQGDWLKALDAIAEKSGWGRQLPRGTGMGVAIDDREPSTRAASSSLHWRQPFRSRRPALLR